jgi:DNA (cytosine-5)-methyltransferase 1
MPEAAMTHRVYFPQTDFVAGDVAAISSWPAADLVIGGYPCQSFSMGGNRRPQDDERSFLFRHFARCVDAVSPSFFVAENVSGLRSVENGRWLDMQTDTFSSLGTGGGYDISWSILHAEDFGVPQRRRRLFIVGVRRDLGLSYRFPAPTHGHRGKDGADRLPFTSHGDAIAGLPLNPTGEYYEYPGRPELEWPWFYMSRNRKAPWDGPAFTVVANARHVTLHPASPIMDLVWSDLANGSKQKWEFSNRYEHTSGHPERPILEVPRRLSWRECALIQTFPPGFEPAGDMMRKYELVGNAVPPMLARAVIAPLVDGTGLVEGIRS